MQQPVYTYNTPGTYNASLIVTSINGCMDTSAVTVTVHAAPQAQFTTTSACFGTTTQFNATPVANASSYQWNFGDFTIGNGVSPNHTYAATGGFNVSMIVTSAEGCRDTTSQTVNVYPIPVANFFSASVCLQNQTVFTDLSTVSGGSTFQYAWNFGDGNTGNTAQTTNTYLQAGIYNVQLTVVTAEGCSASVMKPVEVYHLPVATFNANDNCLNLPTFFNDGSAVAQGSISFWNWTLGDGTNSNMQNPIHTYGFSGAYPVTLQVTSNNGCRSNANDSVTIFRPPTPAPFSQEGCVGANLLFTDNTPSVDPNIIQGWEWDFGNGMTSNLSAPVVAFSTPGPQTVTLTTTNVQGCKGTASITVMMNPLPVAGFTNANGCSGTAVQFNNTSTIGSGGTITGYNWNFGDGTPSSNSTNPSHIFPQAGTYTVMLIVTSNEGCADTATASVIVHPLPVANFYNLPVSGCGPLIVAFTDSSYISSGNISTWFWNFGDGGSSIAQNPVHTFAQSGTYAVSLTVTSNNGCSATATQPNAVTVYPGPMAAFTPSPYTQEITNPVFDFTNHSNGGIVYNWTFGDGTGSLVQHPTHVYSDTGTYTVTLWVTNSYGCRDSATQVVKVDPIFTFFIPNAFTPNGDGVNDGFNVKGISIVDVKLSIFNRWGDHIFFSEGQNNMPWDGSVIGKSDFAKEDVYVYQILVKDVWGVTHERVGHVSLVR
jgi:gliding motility-associated-like protein